MLLNVIKGLIFTASLVVIFQHYDPSPKSYTFCAAVGMLGFILTHTERR